MKSVAVLVLVTGCLSVPDTQQVQCTKNADCDTALGEVCDQGLCWGGAPAGDYALVLGAPSDRTGPISVEIPSVQLPLDGWLGDLALDTPVTIGGRVEPFCEMPTSCTGNSIAATVTVTRRSLFHGGPPFKTVVTSKDGVPRGGDSFSLSLPRLGPGDPDYVVTVVPDGNGDLPPPNGTSFAAELAPPGRMTIHPTTNTDIGTVFLGSATSQVLSGYLTDGNSHPLAKYRVVALGRWDTDSAITEVSTVDYAATGQYSVTLADGVIGPITIEAKAYDSTAVAPILYLAGLPVTSAQHTIAQPPYLGIKTPITLAVEGLTGYGAVQPVVGAHVIVTGEYVPPLNGGAHAVLRIDTTTGDDGRAHLTVLDGSALGMYKLRVVPPTGSNLGVIYDQPFPLDTTMAVRLPPRVALQGQVVDQRGNSAGKISVTARPSLRFSWSLDPIAAEFLAEIPVPTTVTTDDGGFVVYVDGFLATVWGRYDIDFAAPKGVEAASWTLSDIEVPRIANPTAVALGDQTIPDAAFLHGRITDPLGGAVGGGEIRLFKIVTDTSLCDVVLHEPGDCVIPAPLVGRATSDEGGSIKLAVPR